MRTRRLRVLVAIGTAVGACVFAPSAFATVTSSFSDGTLSVSSNADDGITVACSSGNVKVNGGDPGTGAAACADVYEVFVQGGPGPNAIDLSAVDSIGFANEPYVYADGGAGDDTITGSAFSAELAGGAGNDKIDGGDGFDQVHFAGTSSANT